MAQLLRADFHLSDAALEAAKAEPTTNHGGAGSYRKRRDTMRRRVEAAIELERTRGNLLTPDDAKAWLLRVMDVVARMPGRASEDVRAEYAAWYQENHQRRNGTLP